MRTTKVVNPPKDNPSSVSPPETIKDMGFGLQFDLRIKAVKRDQQITIAAETGLNFSPSLLLEDTDRVIQAAHAIATAVIMRSIYILRLKPDPALDDLKESIPENQLTQLIGLLQANKVSVGTTKLSLSKDSKSYTLQTKLERT